MSRIWGAGAKRILFNATCALLVVALASCLNDGTTVPDTAITSDQPETVVPVTPVTPVTPTEPPVTPPPPDPSEPTPRSDQIAVWGDSTTSGIGASNPDLSYPAQLQLLTGRITFNGGVSGQTSDQIAARQGGAPARVTLPDNALPATGSVVLQAQSTFPITAEGPGPLTGTIGGFHGTLSYQPGPQLTFTRDAAGMTESIPAASAFLPDTFARETHLNVFWMGQNNFYDPQGVKFDIAKAVAFLSRNTFIVMSLLNAGDEGVGTSSYDQLAQINAHLAQTYAGNFLDIRKILVNHYDPAAPLDVQDYINDVPPLSLRNDNWHLNDKGYGIVAQQIADFIAAKNW